jgi:hypothetical protein
MGVVIAGFAGVTGGAPLGTGMGIVIAGEVGSEGGGTTRGVPIRMSDEGVMAAISASVGSGSGCAVSGSTTTMRRGGGGAGGGGTGSAPTLPVAWRLLRLPVVSSPPTLPVVESELRFMLTVGVGTYAVCANARAGVETSANTSRNRIRGT